MPAPAWTRAVNVHQLERLAEQVVHPEAWAYVAGGSGDEHTLSWNWQAWAAISLSPHCLVDVSALDLSVELLGRTFPHPLVLAPTAFQGLLHPDGELATRRGAAAAGALSIQSTLSSADVETIGNAASFPWWFQLYAQRDRGFTIELIGRARHAGAEAIVLTVDTPVLGARDRDRRGDGSLLAGREPANLRGLPPGEPDRMPPHRRIYSNALDSTLTWADLGWLADHAGLPVLVKGVLRADDASRAVGNGAAGVIVSNHGGRNLDTVMPTAEALPPIVAAVEGRVPVLVDGGVRRGTDIAKALCLGASAVCIGRPYLWGLALDGAAGVQRVVEMMRTELEQAMALLGAPHLASLTTDLLGATGPLAPRRPTARPPSPPS
jgi:4-hydroxymandelate oxidase